MKTSIYNTIENGHTRCLLAGAAMNKQTDEILYASFVGPGPSCKAIWASIVSCQKKIQVSPYDWNRYKGQKGMKTLQTPFPGTSYYNQIVYYPDTHVILAIEPKATTLIDRHNHKLDQARRSLLEAMKPYLYAKFAEIMNAHTQAVIKTAWAEAIWRAAESYGDNAVRSYHTVGDCVGAFKISAAFNWTGLITELLQQGTISF